MLCRPLRAPLEALTLCVLSGRRSRRLLVGPLLSALWQSDAGHCALWRPRISDTTVDTVCGSHSAHFAELHWAVVSALDCALVDSPLVGSPDCRHQALPPVASYRDIGGSMLAALRHCLPWKILQGAYIHGIRMSACFLRSAGFSNPGRPVIGVVLPLKGDTTPLSADIATFGGKDDYVAAVTNL